MKKILRILIAAIFLIVFFLFNLSAQNYIVNPTTDGGFEGANGWTILNTSNVNKWMVGTSEKSAGTSGAYISNNNITNTVTNPQTTNSKIYIYKDVIVPANATSISISFKYKNAGTDNPPPRCMFERTAAFPALPTNGNSSLIGAEFLTVLNNNSNWVTYNNSLPFSTDRPLTYSSAPLIPGTSYRIVFEWSAAYQTSFTQLPPICTLPTAANISGNLSPLPNSTEIYNIISTGGSNFGYTWSVTGGNLVSGQGTSQVSIFWPAGFSSGEIRCSLGCAAPTYSSNGKTSGPLAIDEVSITYVPTPKIISFSPASAEVGSSVTLTGEYFGATTSDNIVYLNGMKCVISAASPTSITVTVPPHASFGYFTVLNTTTSLSCVSSAKFVPKNSSLVGNIYSSVQNSSFESVQSFSTSFPTSYDQKFVMADIDLDGKLDIMSYSLAGVPQILRNTATSGIINSGAFAAVSSISGVTPSFGGGNTSKNVLMADFNNDGKIDFASSNNANDGGFANINSSTSGSPALENGTVITSSNLEYRVNSAFLPIDINLDGRIDMIGLTGNLSQALVYYTKNTTTAAVFSVTSGNTANTASYNKKLAGGNFYSGAGGDIDGDGKPDVVLGGTNQIYILQNTTNQGYPDNKGFSFSEPVNKPTVSGYSYNIKLADLDGDGKLDIIATNSGSPKISVFKNNSVSSSVSLSDSLNFTATGFTGTYGLAFGDMNGDGKPDIIVSDNVSRIAYFENTSTSGNISFAASITIINGNIAYTQIEIADIDGDGKPDIIAANATTSKIDIFRNRVNEAGIIAANQTICYNTTPAALTSTSAASFPSGAITYKWQKSTSTDSTGFSDIATTNTVGYTIPSALTATTWYRRAASSSDAPSVWYYTNPVKITVTPLPTVSSNTPASSCGANTTVSLAATASSGSINWYDASSAGNLVGSGSPWVTPSLAVTRSYYAEAVTANGCKSSSRTTIAATIITTIPTVSGTAASRCDAGIVTLSATPSPAYGATVNWYASASGGTSLGTGTSFITPSISVTTTYYIDATNCNGTTASRTAVAATVVNTPTIISTAPASGCYNTNVTLSATPSYSSGVTLRWYADPTTTSYSTGNTNNAYVSTGNVTKYVTAISGTCESPRTAVLATMIPLPTVTATSPTTLCGLGTATISATPSAGTIKWYDLISSGTLLFTGTSYTTPSIASTTTYYAAAVNSSGCVSSSRTAVAVTYTGASSSTIANLNAITNSTNKTFVATTLSGSQTSFVWQRSTDNGTIWTDITASLDAGIGITYSGFSGTTANSSTLTLSITPPLAHGYQYRLKLNKGAGCDNYSNAATLFVADVFGSCSSSPMLTLSAHSSYTTLNTSQTVWNFTWQSYITYSYQFGTLTDNNSTSGLIVDNNGAGGSAYIGVDLGSSKLISRVYLQGLYAWDPNMGGDCGGNPCGAMMHYGDWDGGDIQVSTDNSNWTTVYTNVQGTYDGGDYFSFTPVTARYVRAYRLSGSSALSEFHVYAPDFAAPYIRYAPAANQYISTGGVFNQPVIVTAASGKTISSYQWSSSSDNSTFSNLSNTSAITGVTTNTINITNFQSGNALYYKITSNQNDGCSVNFTTRTNLVAPFYTTTTGYASLQNTSSWTTSSGGTGGSAPADFGSDKFFILANAGVNAYSPANNWTVGGTLRLNGNKLTLGSYNATIGTVVESNSTAYVKTNSTGKLISNVSTTAKIFPVGNSSFNPVTITNNTGTADDFSVKVADEVLVDGTSGSSMSNVVNRCWTINKTNANSGGTGIILSFKYKAGDIIGTVAYPVLYAYVSGTGWVAQTANIITRTDTTLTYTGYTGILSNTLFMLSNPVPTITSFTPTGAGNGITVTITGTGFTNASAVSFGGTAATSFNVISATQITAVVAAGSSGSVSVTTPGGPASLSGFTWLDAPVISYFQPTKTNNGNTVTITGNNFNTATAVSFGGTAAFSFSVVSNTQISAVVASGTSGSVSVITYGGTATKTGFVYGLPYSSIDVLAGWNQVNTSSQSYPYTATYVKSTVVSSASQNYSGLTTVNNVNNKWANPNSSVSLDYNTAPYLSYSITTTANTRFDRFVFPGLNMSSSGTPSTKIQLRWSVDNYATSLGEFTPGTSANYYLSSIDLSGTSAQSAAEIQFRAYMYNGNTDNIASIAGNSYTSSDYTPTSYNNTYAAAIYGAIRPTPTLGTMADVNKNVGDPNFYITPPSSNSNGTITFSSSNTNVATISGSSVTIVGAGTSTISASQAATADYSEGSASFTLTVKTIPSIYFSNLNKVVGDAAVTLSATSNSSGGFTYTSNNAGVASISGSTLTIGSAGIATIIVIQAANGNYTSDTIYGYINVGAAALINPTYGPFATINKVVGNPAFTITAPSSNSAGGFTYYSSNPSVATVSGTMITITGPGITTITAYQSTSGIYRSGIVSTVMTVGINGTSNPVISNFPDMTKYLTDAPFTPTSPTSTSSQPFVYFSSNPAVAIAAGNTITICGLGTSVITATQPGGGGYNPGSISSTLTVTHAPAVISYSSPNNYTIGTTISNLTPSSTGGAVISYSVNPGLPSGLSLNTTTGVISGTPSAVSSSKTYVVTATNTYGSTTANVVIAVNDIAPTSLSYTTPNVFSVGTSITVLSPTITGNVDIYSVNPALPSGLVINSSTGEISGTPALMSSENTYVITAANSGGSTTANIVITVNDFSPSGLSYSSPNVLSKGNSIVPIVPSSDGGIITNYSVSPSLPAGLSLNSTTGEITGVPTAVDPMDTYTITGTNSTGSSNSDIEILVNDAAPSNMTYPTPNIFNKNITIIPISPSYDGGVPSSYSVSPPLPNGLTLNTTTGDISGTPTDILAAATYTVTATNFIGTTTADVEIAVNDTPPIGLSYTSPNVYTKDVTIASLSPSVSGGAVVSYGVSPALPTGLSLNTLSGEISGTPTLVLAAATYTVTATNSGGSSSFDLLITVNDIPPVSLSYTSPNIYTKGTPITSLSPSVSGGTVISYTVNPALPNGILLNTLTGEISGTSTVVLAAATYTVTATNSGGNSTFDLEITVNDIAPTDLVYASPNVFTKTVAISNITPTNSGGTVISYSVLPSLPSGLLLNNSTGVISGTPSVLSPQNTYVITASNTGGFTTFNVIITVNAVAPSTLHYTPDSIVATKGVSIIISTPGNNGGDIVHYSINQTLASGLSFDTLTGVISGTPTILMTTLTTYTITGSNTGGSTQCSFKLKVNDVPPSNMTYTPSSLIAAKDVTSISALPSASGGPVVSYNITPALPSGVSLNTVTGEISGISTVLSSLTTYTITATNSGGSTTADFTLTIINCANPTNGGTIASDQTICYGASPTDITGTSTLTGYAGTLQYQWQSSSDNVSFSNLASGTYSSTTYNPGALNDTTWYKRLVRVGCDSEWKESNVVKITVHLLFTAGSIATTGETICYNGNPNEIGSTTAASGGNETITYQWQSSTNAAFTSPTTISSNTAAYDPPTGLIVTTWYRRQAKDGVCNTSWNTSAEVWKVTVYNNFTAGAIANTGETICYSGNPAEIGSTTAASGGNEIITYQWQSSTDAAFTSPTTISSNTAAYDPPTGLTVTTWYRRQAKDAVCNTSWNTSAEVWKVTVYNNFTAGEIANTGETICFNGNPAEIGSTTAASGGNETISYQWQSSTDAAFTSPTTISSNTAAYDPPTGLIVTTWYRRQAKDGVCNTSWNTSAEVWKVTVYNNFTAGAIANTGETICYSGNPAEIGSTTVASGGDENISYQWQSSTDAAFTFPANIISNTTTYDPPAGLTVTTWYRRQAKDGSCNITFSSTAEVWKVTVRPEFTSGVIASAGETVFYDGNPAVINNLTSASGGNEVISYKWQRSTTSSSSGFIDIPGAIASTYDQDTITATTWYRRMAKDGLCNITFTTSAGVWKTTVVNAPNVLVRNTLNIGYGSLRNAVANVANAGTISFITGIDGQTIGLTSGTLIIDKNITLNNSNHTTGITISGSGDNITINTGKKLTIAGNSKITVIGAIKNNAGISGLQIESGASFIQNNIDLAATVKRELSNKWHLFGSPFKKNAGAVLTNITPVGGSVQMKPYTNGTDWITNVTSPNYYLLPTQGYAVKPNITFTASLSGNLYYSPTSFDYTNTLVYNGTSSIQSWNLMANPYTSYIDWKLLGKTNLNNSLYLWDNTLYANISPVANATYFRTFNAQTGIGVPSGTLPFIAPLQGFFVKAISTNPKLNFTPSARVHNTATYYKEATTTEILLRLKTETDEGIDELVICKNPEAKLGFEKFDSEKMFNGNPLEMYTQSTTGERLVINTINTTTQTVIPLCINGNAGKKAKITAFALETTENVYLEDRFKGKLISLSENTSY
ncbi:MAG: putative Ig domain-containing protein, partial [Bacteroidales bacterium]